MPQTHTLKPGHFFLFGAFMILAIILADQYTKWFVLETMLRTKETMLPFGEWFTTRQPIEFFLDQREQYKTVTLASFLNFTMVWNQGISFGLFNSDSDIVRYILIAVALIVSIVMTVWLAVAQGRRLAWALALIIGGAVSNIFDRVRFGAVADFIDVHAGGWHWPAFNIADSCIVIGAILLIIDAGFSKNKSSLW